MQVHVALPVNAIALAVVVVGIVAVDVGVPAVVTMILVLLALSHVNAAIICRRDSGCGRANISCSVHMRGMVMIFFFCSSVFGKSNHEN